MYKRVDKTRARKAFEKGKKVWFLPSKVRFCLNAPFMAPFEVQKGATNIDGYKDFDALSNMYCYYNCNEELGRVVHYYVEDNTK